MKEYRAVAVLQTSSLDVPTGMCLVKDATSGKPGATTTLIVADRDQQRLVSYQPHSSHEQTLLGDPLIVKDRPRQPVDVHYCCNNEDEEGVDHREARPPRGAKLYVTTYDSSSTGDEFDSDNNSEPGGMVIEYTV